MLITSRQTQNWIFPKGWPIKNKTLHFSAKQEAMEEAGVIGKITYVPCAQYKYIKINKRGENLNCRVFLYPMIVTQQLIEWPEKHERKIKWVNLHNAANLVSNKNLCKLIIKMQKINSIQHFNEFIYTN